MTPRIVGAPALGKGEDGFRVKIGMVKPGEKTAYAVYYWTEAECHAMFQALGNIIEPLIETKETA